MKVLVITPTYNEKENLPTLVRAVLAHDGYRIMVVDDASPDGTGRAAEELAAAYPGRVDIVHRIGRRGLGRSYLEGIVRALGTDANFICQMDADLSHDPSYLPSMVAAAAAGCDLVIGSRYVSGVSVVNWPLRRIILSATANRYIRTVTRLPVQDCTTGFRCWRKEALARIPLARIRSEGYSFLVEMLYEAHRAGCRVAELPIIFVERRQGQSKLSTSVLLESTITPWRLVLRRRWRHREIR